MSEVAKLLAAKRANQIARMEGHSVVAYQVTEKALTEAPMGAQRKLSRLEGVVIIITHDDKDRPLLKTVLRNGEDTHFTKT